MVRLAIWVGVLRVLRWFDPDPDRRARLTAEDKAYIERRKHKNKSSNVC